MKLDKIILCLKGCTKAKTKKTRTKSTVRIPTKPRGVCFVASLKHVVNDFYSLTIICEEIRFCKENEEF